MYQYFSNEPEEFANNTGIQSDGLFYAAMAISLIVPVSIWYFTMFKIINKCLLKLKESTEYSAENYPDEESGDKNKIEVLDYFKEKKFEESPLPSIPSSQSESIEGKRVRPFS